MNSILETFGNIIQNNFWIAPFVAVLAGILTSFTPCCSSSVPLIIGYVSGSESNNPKRALKLSLTFALGSALTLTILGIIATIFGKFIRFTGNWWYIFLAVLLILMVLQLWEIINVLPQNNILSKNKKRGYIGAFIAGIFSGLFSSPCSTPVLIVLLAMVSTSGNLLYGIILLLLYSIGHSILVIIAGTSVGFVNKIKKNQNYGLINNIIKISFGVLILILAFYMFYLGI